MNVPTWIKPGIYGAAVGAAAIAIAGFSWGGWMTGSSAREMAADNAKLEVVAALVPICVEQSKLDPQAAVTLAELQQARSYQRNTMIMEAGWATMPGSSEPDRSVATACMERLAAQF